MPDRRHIHILTPAHGAGLRRSGAILAQHVKNFRIQDFRLSWDSVKAHFFTHGIDIAGFEGQ
jgi:hypothetical protein